MPTKGLKIIGFQKKLKYKVRYRSPFVYRYISSKELEGMPSQKCQKTYKSENIFKLNYWVSEWQTNF